MADAVIAAAGSGERLGLSAPKAFADMRGAPIVARALEAFQSSALVGRIVLVVPAGFEDYCRDEVVGRGGFSKVTRIIAGGARRQESVFTGLELLRGEGAPLVAVHDAARPLISVDLLDRTITAAEACGAAIAALPVVDSLKRVEGSEFISETITRRGLWRAQTPQAFRKELLLKAHDAALKDGFAADDDSVLVERIGCRVKVVLGSPFNIKITTSEDLDLAKMLIRL